MIVLIRLWQTDLDKSKLMILPVKKKVLSYNQAISNFRFAASVAAWGMKLSKSDWVKDMTYEKIIFWDKES